MLRKTKLLGVGITSEKTSKILEYVIDRLQNDSKKFFIVTPNPEILVYAQNHLAFKDKLNTADIALADGVGIRMASQLLGLGIPQRTTGVDFIEELCRVSREKPLSIGFLGGRHGVAEQTAECLKQKYPWIKVGFVGEEWPREGVFGMEYLVSSIKEESAGLPNTKYQIRDTRIDILFVAFGFPKQEEWIYEHLEKLPVKAAIGVGGAFDYISGRVPRAPKVIRSVGLEWLFRLIVQPWRLRRQLALLTFLHLALKEKFAKSNLL